MPLSQTDTRLVSDRSQITPPLHRAILDEDGALYSSVTQTVVNLGELFPALQAFTVGAELALVRSTHPGLRATLWVLSVRFVVVPLLALLLVWVTAGRGLYVDDRLVWCVASRLFVGVLLRGWGRS